MSAEQVAELIKSLEASKAQNKGKVPFVSVVRYTTKNKGETGVYLRFSPLGSEWGSSMVKLNAGDKLNAEGKAKLTDIANALGDLVDAGDGLDISIHAAPKPA
jgi:hypothetical protein